MNFLNNNLIIISSTLFTLFQLAEGLKNVNMTKDYCKDITTNISKTDMAVYDVYTTRAVNQTFEILRSIRVFNIQQ